MTAGAEGRRVSMPPERDPYTAGVSAPPQRFPSPSNGARRRLTKSAGAGTHPNGGDVGGAAAMLGLRRRPRVWRRGSGPLRCEAFRPKSLAKPCVRPALKGRAPLARVVVAVVAGEAAHTVFGGQESENGGCARWATPQTYRSSPPPHNPLMRPPLDGRSAACPCHACTSWVCLAGGEGDTPGLHTTQCLRIPVVDYPCLPFPPPATALRGKLEAASAELRATADVAGEAALRRAARRAGRPRRWRPRSRRGLPCDEAFGGPEAVRAGISTRLRFPCVAPGFGRSRADFVEIGPNPVGCGSDLV